MGADVVGLRAMNYRRTFPFIVVLLLAGARPLVLSLSAQSAMMPLLDTFRTEESYLRGVQDISYSVDAIVRMESFYATYTEIFSKAFDI
mgnify:CR=1 FL=1